MRSGRYTNPFSSPYLSSKEVFCFCQIPLILTILIWWGLIFLVWK